MPYEITWLIEGEVIYNRNWGAGTIEDTRQVIRDFRAMTATSERSLVHIIVDNREVTSTPSMIASTKVVREEPKHEKAGWLVAVEVTNPLLHFFTDVTMQLTKQRYRSFRTMTEAIDFLKAADDTVHWEKLPENFQV